MYNETSNITNQRQDIFDFFWKLLQIREFFWNIDSAIIFPLEFWVYEYLNDKFEERFLMEKK